LYLQQPFFVVMGQNSGKTFLAFETWKV